MQQTTVSFPPKPDASSQFTATDASPVHTPGVADAPRADTGSFPAVKPITWPSIRDTVRDRWSYVVGVYMRRQELMVPSHARPPRGSISERLTGKLVYHGELWVDKHHRNRDLIEHFVRIALILSYIKWQPDAIWCLAGARIVERGHLSRAGYNMLELGFMRWQLASDGIDPFEYLYVLERHAVETMIEVWNAKAALSQREPVHTPPSPVKLHAKGCPG